MNRLTISLAFGFAAALASAGTSALAQDRSKVEGWAQCYIADHPGAAANLAFFLSSSSDGNLNIEQGACTENAKGMLSGYSLTRYFLPVYYRAAATCMLGLNPNVGIMATKLDGEAKADEHNLSDEGQLDALTLNELRSSAVQCGVIYPDQAHGYALDDSRRKAIASDIDGTLLVYLAGAADNA